jgi:nitroimidazol reductase NimA-like FMN-containing flavoprotein (pyridoxamine 5'-phosphate oxidase superfamily)
MNHQQDLEALAKEIIDTNFYMTLGTADEQRRPWVSPVYYAVADYRKFYWVSSPDVRHSHNIAVRSHISIVIFNSQAAIGTGQAVYMSAVAEMLSGAELERGIRIYSRTSVAQGAPEWNTEDVQIPAPHRLYRATVSEHSVLESEEGRPNHRRVITMSVEDRE